VLDSEGEMLVHLVGDDDGIVAVGELDDEFGDELDGKRNANEEGTR